MEVKNVINCNVIVVKKFFWGGALFHLPMTITIAFLATFYPILCEEHVTNSNIG